MKFEQAISELQQIVEKMESDKISLDESLNLYEKGIELCNLCAAELENVKGKIAKLTANGEEPLKINL